MTRTKKKGVDPIDVFTRARFKDARLGERFFALRDLHQKASDAMWAGWLTSSFTDDEIERVRRFSLLSAHDEALITGARTGRPQPFSVVPVSVLGADTREDEK